jgi:signal transduction histidine kinase
MQTESETSLIDRLAGHKTVGSAPREELEWVVAHGRLRHLDPGEVLTARAAGFVEGLFLVLTGQIGLHVDRANGREKIVEWHAGDVAGLLPYSRLQSPPGDSVAEQPTDIVVIHRDDLPELIRECHQMTSILVHTMVDRARHFTSSDLQAEKMVSLGKLSAGLAHELNNPASAISRNARALREAMTTSEATSSALGALGLTGTKAAAIAAVRQGCIGSSTGAVRSPLEEADREGEISDWLEAHGADGADAAALAETDVTMETLDSLSAVLNGTELTAAVQWLAAACVTRRLADDIEQAGARISSLIDAVKGFTRMDLNATAGPVDIADGLVQTLAILKSKARAKSVSVTVEVGADLPRALGVAGELNQIWANLIDNALDAAPEHGHVRIVGGVEASFVTIRIIDDGPGMPPEVKRRIFDPFFTTKKVGEGTGLGLDIVNRIIRKHKGMIAVESEPGHTEFKVSLPIAPPPAEAASA